MSTTPDCWLSLFREKYKQLLGLAQSACFSLIISASLPSGRRALELLGFGCSPAFCREEEDAFSPDLWCLSLELCCWTWGFQSFAGAACGWGWLICRLPCCWNVLLTKSICSPKVMVYSLCWHPRASSVLFALLWLSQGNESLCNIRPLVLFYLQQYQMLCRKRWRVNYLFSVTKMNTEIISKSFGLFPSRGLLIHSLRSHI